MIELKLLPNIANIQIEISDDGQRVLTIYTPLATFMGSPDWERFCELRARIHSLIEFSNGYDEVRIKSLHPVELSERSIRLDALGDPEL